MARSGYAVSRWPVTAFRLCRDTPLSFDQTARYFDTAGCLSNRLCEVGCCRDAGQFKSPLVLGCFGGVGTLAVPRQGRLVQPPPAPDYSDLVSIQQRCQH
jgi:hypothetical protein